MFVVWRVCILALQEDFINELLVGLFLLNLYVNLSNRGGVGGKYWLIIVVMVTSNKVKVLSNLICKNRRLGESIS